MTVVAIAMPSLAGDGSIVVFYNPAIRPYRLVLDGFKQSCRCAVREYPLRNGGRSEGPFGFGGEKPDLILAIGLDALRSAEAIRGVPIISTMVPKAQARPGTGSTVTGIDMTLPPASYLEAMRRLFPAAKRIGVLYDPALLGEYVAAAAKAADGLGFRLVLREATRPADMPALLGNLRREIDLFWMLPDPTVAREETLNALLLFSFENKVPIFTFAKKYVEMGALAALTIDPVEIGVQAGEKARALRSGETGVAAPAWEYIRKHSLALNKKVGKKMGFDLDARGEAADVID